jgi:hypothetical protein
VLLGDDDENFAHLLLVVLQRVPGRHQATRS